MKRVLFAAVVLLLTFVSLSQAQTRVIVGRVMDSTYGEPLNAGLIRVLGTPIQAQIRVDGTFVLYVPVREVTLGFEAAGFQKREVRVNSEQETVIIAVRRDIFELSKVVVSGQATGI